MSEPKDEKGTVGRSDERREAKRFRLTAQVRVVWDEGSLWGYSTDLSRGGVFVETPRQIAVDTDLKLDFIIFRQGLRETVEVKGRVARLVGTEEGATKGEMRGLGIEFREIDRGRDLLLDYLEARLQAAAVELSQDPERPSRQGVRLELGLPVLWGPDESLDRQGVLLSLSSSGTFLHEAKELEPPGSRLHLWFELPVDARPKPLQARAKVVRVVRAGGSQPAGMGLDLELSDEQSAVIDRFLEQRLAGKARTGSGQEKTSSKEQEGEQDARYPDDPQPKLVLR